MNNSEKNNSIFNKSFAEIEEFEKNTNSVVLIADQTMVTFQKTMTVLNENETWDKFFDKNEHGLYIAMDIYKQQQCHTVILGEEIQRLKKYLNDNF